MGRSSTATLKGLWKTTARIVPSVAILLLFSGQLVPGRGVTEEVEILSRASVGNQPHGPNAVSPVLTGSMGSTTGY